MQIAANPLVERLMAFAESSYPLYFPGRQDTRRFDSFQYRYYPITGNYLLVAGSGVYVAGPSFGPEFLYVGQITDFVQPGTQITGQRLASCPINSGFAPDNVLDCLTGSLLGTEAFDETKTCQLEIESSGTFKLSFSGRTNSSARPFGFVNYIHFESNYLDITVGPKDVAMGYTFTFQTSAGYRHATGGEVRVTVIPRDSSSGETPITCKFEVKPT